MKTKLLALLTGTVLFMLMAFTDNGHFIDSLNGELNRAKNEIRRLHFQTEIAAAMDDRDSAVKLLETVLGRSVELNHRLLELGANKTLGSIYMSMQDPHNALPYINRALFLSRELRDTLNQAETMMQLGDVCSLETKYKKSGLLYRSAAMLLQQTGLSDKNYIQKLGLVFHHQAGSFAAQQMLDSAQNFEEKSIALFTLAGSNTDRSVALASLASFQSKQNNHEGAISSLNLALDVCAPDDAPMAAAGLSQLALEYSATGNVKMARQKADSALLIAGKVDAPRAKVAAFQALAQINEKVNDYKMALHYYDSATVLSTQILSDQSAAKIVFAQNIHNRQSERTLAEKEEAATLRISNMRMVGIGIFLITALVFGFAVSRHKHGPMVTKVLGAMALLLTFELISLAAHPFMEKWTNHSSMYMFIILAVVAGILVSLHHQIEDMVRKFLHTEG